jgi:hypothetical protein
MEMAILPEKDAKNDNPSSLGAESQQIEAWKLLRKCLGEDRLKTN